jgi:hypothetical protein
MTDPGSSPLAIQDAIALFRKPEALNWAPYLIVLGPPGSGKSDYLRSLRSALNGDAPESGHLLLDLRRISINDEDHMYLELASLCRGGATPKPGGRAARGASGGARAFEETLSELLNDLGRLTLYVDNLESVPRYFARALTRKFRQFWEERDDRAEYCQLGVVFSGSLSLFELKQDFLKESPVLLPFLDLERRLEGVRNCMHTFGCESPSQVILDLLAAETGGEPAFLVPLLKRICGGRRNLLLDEGSVIRALDELSSPSWSHPILEDIALHLYGSPELLDIVSQLNAGQPFVRPRDHAVDIDRFHLMGAVVLDRDSEPRSYRFRNGLVARYCRGILAQPALRTRRMAHGRSWNSSPTAQQLDDSGVGSLESLEATRIKILLSADVWVCLSEMQRLWKLSTLYPAGHTDLYLYTAEGFWWWFDSLRKEKKSRPRGESDEAPVRAVTAALQDRIPSFGLDAHEVAFAVPLHGSVAPLFVVVQLRRSDLDDALGENALIHWQRFVQEFAAILESRALAEFGREALKKQTETTKQVTSGGADIDQKLQISLRLAEEGVDRQLDIARFGILGIILVGTALGTWWAIPWVIDNFAVLEPLQFLISLVLTVIWIVIAFLGYRFDPFQIWRRARKWIRPKLIERRAAYWQHRLKTGP